jgi:uncharacterized OB-fold protein
MNGVATSPRADWLVPDELAPATHGRLAPLYQASARGEVAMPFCGACGQPLELEQVVCDGCGAAAVGWRAVEPSGTVHAVTTVHRREPGLVLTDAPYHVVDVELDSGHRVIMTTDRPVSTAPCIGHRVRVTFRFIGSVAVPAIAAEHLGDHEQEESR